jgi:hypothetical protein
MASRSKNARFGFIQSIHAKEYFLHLYSIFSHLCIANYRTYSYNDKRTQKTYISLNFWTRALPIFTEFYNMFYVGKVKVIPHSFYLLSPLALAHWIMQDGSFSSSRGIYLCTENFLASDTARLANHLRDVLKIKCTTPKAPGKSGLKGHARIYISAKSLPIVQ